MILDPTAIVACALLLIPFCGGFISVGFLLGLIESVLNGWPFFTENAFFLMAIALALNTVYRYELRVVFRNPEGSRQLQQLGLSRHTWQILLPMAWICGALSAVWVMA